MLLSQNRTFKLNSYLNKDLEQKVGIKVSHCKINATQKPTSNLFLSTIYKYSKLHYTYKTMQHVHLRSINHNNKAKSCLIRIASVRLTTHACLLPHSELKLYS